MRAFLIAGIVTILTWPAVAVAKQSAHGSDNRNPGDIAAWFLGADRTVDYCLQVDPEFGLTQEFLSMSVKVAIQQWVDYMERKLPLADIEAAYRHRSYTRNFAEQGCTESTDLVFYFGVEDELIREHKRYYVDPAAFAHRTKKDYANGWSQGFIWFTNPRSFVFFLTGNDAGAQQVGLDWQSPHTFKAMLMHELGHVFGNPHVPGTVMAADILKRILGPKLFPRTCPSADPGVAQIDDLKELVPCINCERGDSYAWSGTVDRLAFRQVFGRPPIGTVRAALKVQAQTEPGHRLEIEIADDIGRRGIELDTQFYFGSTTLSYDGDSGQSTFQIFFQEENYPRFGHFMHRSWELGSPGGFLLPPGDDDQPSEPDDQPSEPNDPVQPDDADEPQISQPSSRGDDGASDQRSNYVELLTDAEQPADEDQPAFGGRDGWSYLLEYNRDATTPMVATIYGPNYAFRFTANSSARRCRIPDVQPVPFWQTPIDQFEPSPLPDDHVDL